MCLLKAEQALLVTRSRTLSIVNGVDLARKKLVKTRGSLRGSIRHLKQEPRLKMKKINKQNHGMGPRLEPLKIKRF